MGSLAQRFETLELEMLQVLLMMRLRPDLFLHPHSWFYFLTGSPSMYHLREMKRFLSQVCSPFTEGHIPSSAVWPAFNKPWSPSTDSMVTNWVMLQEVHLNEVQRESKPNQRRCNNYQHAPPSRSQRESTLNASVLTLDHP